MTGKSQRLRRLVSLTVAFACLVVLGLSSTAGAAEVGFFTPTGSMSVPRDDAVAAPLPDGRVLVAGGHYNDNDNDGAYTGYSSAEIFDPTTNTFSSAGIGSMSVVRDGAAAAPLPDGRVLIAGGNSGPEGAYLSSAEIFNPATKTFSSAGIGSMSVPRAGAVAAPLPDGRVLVAGGYYCDGLYCSQQHFLSSAEIFDPATNSFSSAGVGSLTTWRDLSVASSLPDGRVLIAGGGSGDSYLTTMYPCNFAGAEVFNPATTSFSSAGIGRMAASRGGAAAAPLPGGRALVAGGSAGSPRCGDSSSSAEIFNSATNTFSSAGIGSMTYPRYAGPAAAPLPDGRVLVAGGGFPLKPALSAEIFTLSTNSFTFSVQDRRLIVHVQAPGSVFIADAASPLRASAAKKRKRTRLLRASSAAGDPPTITVPLTLTKLAKRRLKQKGRITVNARITFTGPGGLANTQSAKLKIRGKKRKG